MGTLGAGNHYAEIQVIDKVFDDAAARKMGIDQEGQVRTPQALARAPALLLCFAPRSLIHVDWAVLRLMSAITMAVMLCLWEKAKSHRRWVLQVCIMIHSGSRGLGHQVATDALTSMERAMARDNIQTNDRQLACARINSQVWCFCQLHLVHTYHLPGALRAFSKGCTLCRRGRTTWLPCRARPTTRGSTGPP